MHLEANSALAVAVVSAIQGGDVVALRQLLAEHPDLVNSRIVDERRVGRTLLHIVADWPGHFPNGAQVVKVLIAAGADPSPVIENPPHKHAETPLPLGG